ncbi:MAG: hypothetical protein ABIR05_05590 [Luteimonas sp.]
MVGAMQRSAGLMLLLVSQGRLVAIAGLLTRPELAEGPHDAIAWFLRHSAEKFGQGTQVFVSLYLATHRLIKILLVPVCFEASCGRIRLRSGCLSPSSCISVIATRRPTRSGWCC